MRTEVYELEDEEARHCQGPNADAFISGFRRGFAKGHRLPACIELMHAGKLVAAFDLTQEEIDAAAKQLGEQIEAGTAGDYGVFDPTDY